MSVKKASLRLPAALTSRRVWIGAYGGPFSAVVVFNKKPVKLGKGTWDEGAYDPDTNKNIVAGTFDLETFNEWFGTDIQAADTGIMKVEAYNLTAIWDKYAQIVGLNPYYDR
jgi:hypothetical protein